MGLRSFQLTTTQFRRRKNEKRKEKSREAARHRRSQESDILTDMANLLPVPISVSSQLDKTSILRLTLAFLKAQSLLDSSEFLSASVSCVSQFKNQIKYKSDDAYVYFYFFHRYPRTVQYVVWRQMLDGWFLLAQSIGRLVIGVIVRRGHYLPDWERNRTTGYSTGKKKIA